MNARSLLRLVLPLLFGASAIACSGVPTHNAAQLNSDGNKQYAAGKYPSALETYRRAEVLRPDLPALNYNAANTLNQQHDYQRAVSESEQAVHSTDPAVQDRAYYSMANAYVRQNQLREAVDAYKSALRVAPSDVDAKYNLEVIERELAQENVAQQGQQAGQAQQSNAAQQSGSGQGQPASASQAQAGQGQGQPGAEAESGQPQAGQAAGQASAAQPGQGSGSTNGSASGYTGTPEGQAAALDPSLKQALGTFDKTGNVDDALRALDIAGQQERLQQAGSGGTTQPQGRDW